MCLTTLAVLPAVSACADATAAASSGNAAEAVIFNDAFLPRTGGKPVDVSRFAHGNPVPAGTYRTSVYINGQGRGDMELTFMSPTGREDDVGPCFNAMLLEQLGVDITRLPADAAQRLDAASTAHYCQPLNDVIAQATTSYDLSAQRIDLGVPQVMMKHVARGYVSPALWDRGIDAALLSYNLNSFRFTPSSQNAVQSNYLGLNAGANLGDWHLRHTAALDWGSSEPTHYQSIATYAQRDLPTLQSQLVVGDAFTSGEIFDSISFRGVQLASDIRMQPDSQRGYAPVVRGTANSNARVTITQKSNILYETTVAPGAFEINDLYPTGYGGDLVVTVTEADGTQHSFSLPYSALPQLVRVGSNRFSLTAGVLRSNAVVTDMHQPQEGLLQGTLQHGISNDLTGYTGAIVAQGYYAGLLGSAVNTRLGAIAADVTVAQAVMPYGNQYKGQSLRLGYSKLVPETATSFSMAAYRYSSSRYLGLTDAMTARTYAGNGYDPELISRQRSRLQLTLNQGLGAGIGAFYFTGSAQDYWNRDGSDTQFQVGYTNLWHTLTWTVSAARQQDIGSGEATTRYQIGMMVPLGRSAHTPVFTANLAADSNGYQSMQTGLSGTAGQDNVFSYGVNANADNTSTSAGVNGNYRTSVADFAASYSRGSNYEQASFGVSGGIVAHAGGVTFGQPLGETVGIVDARGASGARVSNATGVTVNGKGFAIIPYLSPYELNTVDLDPKGTSVDVQLLSTSQRTAPHAGAVVRLKFDTVSGRSAVIHAPRSNGGPLPFGAPVQDAQGRNIGMVGQASRIFVQGIGDSGVLSVKWGEGRDEHCTLVFHLPAVTGAAAGAMDHAESVCRSDVSESRVGLNR